MRNPTDEEIAGFLVQLMTAAFNRSIGALEAARALDTRKMREHYHGVGSRYYDLVTEQMELTAKIGAPGVRRLFQEKDEGPAST